MMSFLNSSSLSVSRRWSARSKHLVQLLRRRPRGYQHFLLSTLSARLRTGRSFGNPVSITLEPTNICNLRCPVCETGAGLLDRRPENMSYEAFVKILEKVGPGANHLMFYYMGEPFLNKDAYRMIRYARDMGLYVTTCTNGDLINPEALYESGINHISFQIGGLTQETHQFYRQNSDLSRVLENLRSYVSLIREKGKKTDEHEVELGFIVMKQNENEIEDVYRLGKAWGVKTTLISPCVRTSEQGKSFLPSDEKYWLYDRHSLEEKGQLVIKRNLPRRDCPWIYYSITILVDGSVVPCCRDAQGKYIMGNLLSNSLEKTWNGRGFKRFRYQFSRLRDSLPLCTLCPGEGTPELK
ncbi:MAG: radical SAM protein [Deltaproteobacteria bacterium]|nr:radical SAM protein [Deltaproteobacteria bacterium]MBM4323597.1 radical SAM protein [Deltaproteobacteria bacterium]